MSIAQTFPEMLRRFQARIPGRQAELQKVDEEAPLRAELYSSEQMALHGKALAAVHQLDVGPASDLLLRRLADNENVLVGVCKLLTSAVADNRRVTPAAEWLLDNFYLIEEQIRTAKRHLPKGYSRELPRLLAGQSAGRPRVYDIALETVAHGDGRVDAETLTRFVAAYQSVTDLKLGELWAIPIMLRLAIIENLRRVATRIAGGWKERRLADEWADQMVEAAENDPKSLILVIADMARSNPPMNSSFVAELARRLQGRGPALALPLTWVEQHLAESQLSIAQLVQAENQRQAADQVSISNSIGSLRVLGAMNWQEFVENLSVVEQCLREDPAGIYGRMDFATRDRYRHAAEAIARRSHLSEREVARHAVELAQGNASVGSSERTGHVGFYLVGKGVSQIDALAAPKLSGPEIICRDAGRRPLAVYLGAIALLSLGLSGIILLSGTPAGLSLWLLLPAGLVVLTAASQLAQALVNWLATVLVKAHSLPRMDFSLGIPSSARTLVVVPTMLTSTAGVEDLVESLEVRYLANSDQNVHFGLLTDFTDAGEESLAGDAPLLVLASLRISELNSRYAQPGVSSRGDIFFLFHRPRRWNAHDGVWMGYERKRGKLGDLNALLRGNRSGFSEIVGDISILTAVRYVITLDTDTQLPRDAARQFIGAMAHPLNRPHYDPALQRITEGYGIMQPRVAVSLPGSNRSRYARLYGGEPGIDPYTQAVSDVYQDVFGEGSFIGKGIYDVDAFEQVLGGRFPENCILSHDLLEGCHARSGLLSDVALYEDYPARYSADVSRRYRWIRGDWQLVGWLWRCVPRGSANSWSRRQRNPLSALSQWKLFDNLRRSLVPAALTLILLAGWMASSVALLWTFAVIGILIIPSLCAASLDLLRKPDEVTFNRHFAAVASAAYRHLRQVGFELACLPYTAYFSSDAILRTLWRVLLTRKQLLEWNPSSEVDRVLASRDSSGLAATVRSMWIGPALAAGSGAYLAATAPETLLTAGGILFLWLFSPGIAWWVSRPLLHRPARLSTEQTIFLCQLSRRTWAFFDNFVGPEEHWLPPDNFQEYRVASLAHRTSPTNIGLALLANLAAYDFGYITTGRLLERTTRTLDTMAGLGRHRGHFYNWYDTLSLQPLIPLYVSTVDSGNLAGHLLTLRAGLLALVDEPILPTRFYAGLQDTFGLLVESAETSVKPELANFDRLLAEASAGRAGNTANLRNLLGSATALATAVTSSLNSRDAGLPESDADYWAQGLVRQIDEALAELAVFAESVAAEHLPTLHALELQGQAVAAERRRLIERLARRCGELAEMDYDFLFDKSRHLLSIGYNVLERRSDTSYYDLLASEARLSSFVAIAQGQVPQESWFSLGRLLTATAGEPALLSWSGSMFEYLMPLLVMPTYENTLLDQTCKAAVARQIEYGRQRGVPWGISESGYNTVDVHLNYQYRAFGVPGLGLKRGLGEDLVIAPYASVLALMVAPEPACENLQRLSNEGFSGKFGFFEAIDYTPARQRRGQTQVVVRSFMAHHQGMSLLALASLLLDHPMQRRFESERRFQAVILLLQERIPKETTLFAHTAELSEMRSTSPEEEVQIRVFTTPDTPIPEVQLLSNGRYHVMLTNAGGGYSRWNELAVTRWREDGTRDNQGSFCYVRDLASQVFWSNTHQPTLLPAASYEAIFSEGRAEFRRQDIVGSTNTGFETYTEIVVSPEDDIELRRIRITNRSRQWRQIDVTSYAEVVIAPPASDNLHPAFSNLFVQTEILSDRRAILCTRRPRSIDERPPLMLHLMAVHGAEEGDVSYETDRLRFIGRTRTTAEPVAMDEGSTLSGTDGAVLDPIVAIRHALTLAPEQSVVIDIVTGIAANRDQALCLIDKYQDRHLADRVFELTWTHSQVVLRQLNASEANAQLYARLASSVIHANGSMRTDASVLSCNRRGQSGLWGYAISGDLPIVLLQIGDAANIDLVRQLVQAHAYWGLKGLAVDLVIWNEDHAGYRQRLQEQIMGLIASGIEASLIDRPGGIFVRLAEQISAEDRILLQSVARVVVTDCRGGLAEQLEQRRPPEARVPRLETSRRHRPEAPPPASVPRPELLFQNGLGGFTPDGREYVISLSPGQTTPAPWCNVLANPHFGTVISESGMAYTWSENAHEFRLTPWHDDPVSDTGGEAIYLRDEESGHYWSPTPLPARNGLTYVIRHGFGYSVFETISGGIRSELWVFVATDAAVKFSLLKIRNESGRPRTISATAFVEWVLGDFPAKSAMHIATELAPANGALYARNPYSTEFAERVAFFDVDDSARTLTGDRVEFIGRNGSMQHPSALKRARLSGKVGVGMDPCGALQVSLVLAGGEERELVFRLGVGQNTDDADRLVQSFRGLPAAKRALDSVHQYWQLTLGAVQVETPDAAVNLMANGWLVYQTLACRLWARSGYYQSGGAFGFRDQLQDVMALVHAAPSLVREHLLLCASRQFLEGDVQHWWHPPSGRGVRTHCSDDYLWLPLAVCRYVTSSGDIGILGEQVHFLEGRAVNPEDDSYYDLPGRSADAASLYEHCVRAIKHGLRFGEHGLPLIGAGDWNDSMNRVGVEGKGESVWLAFFFCDVLGQFSDVALGQGDSSFAETCRNEGARLRSSIDATAWDGDWYKRAYFDNGTPLGSSQNEECQIDSISQSWSVLSCAGREDRSRRAMQAVDERLVRRRDGLVQLLDPPFSKTIQDPGYIRGYVPGVRENGGQYTHAAVWAAMAFAQLGDNGRANELLSMINPINHTGSADAVATYKVEPYVVSADVYAVAPHIGRGGWSWYTGSAGWMYRSIIESQLGLRRQGDTLHFTPCLSPDWPSCTLHYRFQETSYQIEMATIKTGGGAGLITIVEDGILQQDAFVRLRNDRRVHVVHVSIPCKPFQNN